MWLKNVGTFVLFNALMTNEYMVEITQKTLKFWIEKQRKANTKINDK